MRLLTVSYNHFSIHAVWSNIAKFHSNVGIKIRTIVKRYAKHLSHPFPILCTSPALRNLSTTSLMPSSGVKVTIVIPPVALVRVRPSE